MVEVHGVKEENAELAAAAKVLPTYSKELDIDALFRDEAAELSTSVEKRSAQGVLKAFW